MSIKSKGGTLMAYTTFGEFVRILRIKHHEVMGDMAKVLNTSLPFMSAVENGKKNVPTEWIEKIVEHYNLSESEREKFEILERCEVVPSFSFEDRHNSKYFPEGMTHSKNENEFEKIFDDFLSRN